MIEKVLISFENSEQFQWNFQEKCDLGWGQIDRFPSLFRVKLFSFCIHILHSFLNVRVVMSIILSNLAKIVFENSCMWKYPLLKVLNDSLIIILEFCLIILRALMLITKDNTYNMMHKLTLIIYLVTSFLKKHSIKKWSKIFVTFPVSKLLSEVFTLCSQIVELPNICQKKIMIIFANCEERRGQNFSSFQIKEAI